MAFTRPKYKTAFKTVVRSGGRKKRGVRKYKGGGVGATIAAASLPTAMRILKMVYDRGITMSDAPEAMMNTYKKLRKQTQELTKKIGGKIVRLGTTPANKQTPGVEEKNTTTKLSEFYPSRNNNPQDVHVGTTHKSSFTTGRPTTSSLKTVAKENGTDTITIRDTKFEAMPGDVERLADVTRHTLDHSCGFNHKNIWFLPGASYISVFDMIKTIQGRFHGLTEDASTLGFINTTTSAEFTDKKLAAVMNTTTELSLYNENRYLPIILKIHVIRPRNSMDVGNGGVDFYTDDRTQLRRLVARTFNRNVSVQSPFAIPYRYQFVAPKIEDTDRAIDPIDLNVYESANVDLSNKAQLNMSPYFRDNFDIVETQTKKLMAQDTWNFKHEHNYGPGIDVNELRGYAKNMQVWNLGQDVGGNTLRTDAPMTYMYAVEVKGVPGACVYSKQSSDGQTASNTTYQGTLPGYYHCEMRTKVKYVKISQFASTTGLDGSNQPMYSRTWTKQDYQYGNQKRERHVLAQNIVRNAEDLTPGKALIPVTTDQRTFGAGPQLSGDDPEL